MSNLLQVQITKLKHYLDLPLPSYATLHSAGMDLLAAINETQILKPLQRLLIPTGIAIALPIGYEGQIRSRSGLAYKNGIIVINSPGTIDPDYRGEIFVPLINLSDQDFTIERGMRIAQIIIGQFSPVSWDVMESLEASDRGNGGFGSTGI